MSLTLPAGFESRAAGIAALVARRLAALRLESSATIDQLRLDGVRVGAEASDDAVAAHVVAAVQRSLRSSSPVAGPAGEG